MQTAMRFKRHEAASYLEQGFSSRLLAPKIGISQRTAVNWAREYREKGKSAFLAGPSFLPMPHHRLTKRDVHKVVSHFKNNAHRDDFSTRVAARELKARKGVDISYRWAGTLAHRAGLPARLRTHKPQTKPEQRQKRVVFAKGWNRPETAVVFTDEFGVALDGLIHVRHWFWGPRNKPVPPIGTRKYPPVLHIFAAVTRTRTIPLQFYEGTLNSERFCSELLSPAIDLCAAAFGDEEWILQHDGASYYTSGYTQDWLQRNPRVPFFFAHEEWPPVSPDLNLIENLFGTVKTRALKRGPKNKEQLRQFLQEEWSAVTETELAALYASFPKRLEAVVKGRGRPTRY